MLGWKHEGFRYSCKRPLSLGATVPQASLSITPRYQAWSSGSSPIYAAAVPMSS